MADINTGMKYWLFFEDNQNYYCEDCIDDRLQKANDNKEFPAHYDYDNGESTGFMSDWSYEEEICCCETCGKQIITEYYEEELDF
jgi:hypothetical protein